MLIPQHWGDNDMDIFDKAIFGITPKLDGHKPDERNEQGFTVAMILTNHNKNIPNEWYHDSSI